MSSNWWATTLSLIEIAGQLFVLVAMLRHRLISRWPSIFTACAIDLALYTTLLSLTRIPHHYTAYFYLYWSGVALQAAIRLWMTCDILRSIPAIGAIPKRWGLFVSAVGLTTAVIAWEISFRDGVRFASHIAASAVLFDRCVNYAWMAFLAVIFAAIALVRLGWDERGARVTYGIVFHIASRLVVSTMLSLGSKPVRSAANAVDSLTYIAVLAFWFACFSESKNQPNVSTQSDPQTTEIHLGLAS